MTYAQEAAANGPLFIEAFYDACESFGGKDSDVWVPDVELINEVLVKHEVGYVVRPPRLELRDYIVPVVPVAEPPPTLTERTGGFHSVTYSTSTVTCLRTFMPR